MASYDYGKQEVIDYIVQMAKKKDEYDTFSILDVGTCDGKWADMIRAAFEAELLDENEMPELVIDGVEAFKPNALRCINKYDNFYVGNVGDYHWQYLRYDVVIFGDVIEHMEVAAAEWCLDYAVHNAAEVIVGVPYLYKQGAIYGNPYEVHIQDDLTHELFMERYGRLGWQTLIQPTGDYEYFIKAKEA